MITTLLWIVGIVFVLVLFGAIYCYYRFEKTPLNRAEDPTLDPESFGEHDGQDD